jgi:Methyltransferase domain
MVAFLESREIKGATVVEIGGGVGEIGLELLKRGAVHTVNLELSPACEEDARRLLREHGLEERTTWRLHDIAADPDAIDSADIVALHRVVCCYPESRRLLGAAADHARRFVVFSYPPRNPSRASSSPARTSSAVLSARSFEPSPPDPRGFRCAPRQRAGVDREFEGGSNEVLARDHNESRGRVLPGRVILRRLTPTPRGSANEREGRCRSIYRGSTTRRRLGPG